MSSQTLPIKNNSLAIAFLAVVSGLIVIASMTGLSQSHGIGDRTVFFILFFVGFAICGMGKLGRGSVYGWWNIRHLAGYVLGATILALALGVWLGWKLPGIPSTRAATIALSLLMLVKLGIAVTYPRRS